MTRRTTERAAIALSESLNTDNIARHNNGHESQPMVTHVVIAGIGTVAPCGCVLTDARDYEPCEAHDAALATLEATGGVGLDRVPLADAGFSMLRMPGAARRTHALLPGRHKRTTHRSLAYRVADVTEWPCDVVETSIERTFVTDGKRTRRVVDATIKLPRCSALLGVILRDAQAEARASHVADAEAKRRATGNAGRPTTRAARATPRKRRTAAEMAIEHNNGHETRPMVDVDAIARALAVGGDTWADRQG